MKRLTSSKYLGFKMIQEDGSNYITFAFIVILVKN